ncbi:hypothetical protein [Phenylobacterium sp.]|uniref:hypothetical protein n=1 Tax=Phenylobacterium sp. TaxID=1871053 RepID=UPI002731BA23|nr:hypothetical protein [Phenylobacterium sp.]MDP1618658.1 hypothetical protein [Phenylobacterium sp.]MDP1987198.1 hypothetical protein [Phenylobacterium sp.]
MTSTDRNGRGRREALEATSPLEWLVAALGALLVLFAVGSMAYFAMNHPEGPPQVSLEVTEIRSSGEGYLVSFEAKNTGRSTAAGIVVTGTLTSGGEPIEESEVTLDYLPQDSERRGGLFFREDPAAHDLDLRAQGYSKP